MKPQVENKLISKRLLARLAASSQNSIVSSKLGWLAASSPLGQKKTNWLLWFGWVWRFASTFPFSIAVQGPKNRSKPPVDLVANGRKCTLWAQFAKCQKTKCSYLTCRGFDMSNIDNLQATAKHRLERRSGFCGVLPLRIRELVEKHRASTASSNQIP